MKPTTEIVRIAPYGVIHIWCEKHQCRHPIDKPCDAKIEAYRLEFEAEVKEKERQRKKRSREKINEINDGVQDATVENIGESLEDDPEACAEAKREFVRERWDEIAVARKQLDANGADHEDRWIEGDR